MFNVRRLWGRRAAVPDEAGPPPFRAWTLDPAERATAVELAAFCQDEGIEQFTICGGGELPPSRKLEILRQMAAKIRAAEAGAIPE